MVGSIDYMFSQLAITGNSWATTLAGFILVLIILFGVIAFFGKNKQQLDSFGIVVTVFLASVLATAMGLFSAVVLVVMLILSLVFIVIKTLFFGGQSQ